MRIALVMPQMDPSRGGAEAWLAGFMPLLVRQGHELHVLTLDPTTHDLPVERHRIEPHGWTRAQRIWSFARQAADWLDREEFDVVHDLGYGYECNVLQPHGGTRPRSYQQNLLCVDGSLRRALKAWGYRIDPSYRAYNRIASRQYDPEADRLFVAISNMVAGDMKRFYDVPESKVRLVYNGVDVERFHPRHRETHRERVRGEWGAGDRTVFLLAAHNLRLKGMVDLVHVSAKLKARREDFLVMVVGRGDPRPYQNLAQQLGCADQVRFVGPMPEVAPCYAAADVYIQPTYYDPCSLVVLEALASGMPVITTRFNGAGELIEHGRDGYVVDTPWNHEVLVESMIPCFDAAHRARLGDSARRVAEAHGLDHNYQEMLAVYEEAALL